MLLFQTNKDEMMTMMMTMMNSFITLSSI